jgi:SAM-dependent methyltransferase
MDKITHTEVLNANRAFYDKMVDLYRNNEYYAYQPSIVYDVKKNIEFCVKNLSRRDTFVDVGCGSGFLSSLARDFFADGIGIDISIGQLRSFKKEVPQYSPLLGDITRLSLRSQSVDMVGSYSVLHHILDYHRVIDEMTRILRGGGILYVDFEPNSTFHRKMRFLINLRKRILDQDPSGLDLEKIAEFHHNYSDGIDKEELLSRLSRDYRILMVGSRFPKYNFPQSLITLGLQFVAKITPQKLDPYFWIIAKKNSKCP